MKRLIIIGVLIIIQLFSFSQNQDVKENDSGKSSVGTTMFDVRRNAVYTEDLFIYAYERLLPVSDKFGIALKGGISIFEAITPVVEITTVFGGPKHFFETGVGGITDFSGGFVLLRAGYRYQATKGFLCKVSPAFLLPDKYILPLITVGYAF